ncbi:MULTISPECIES: DUF6069 family protein [Oerskovia]|uniref:DUF6069 family protein n=1 Tax=Oerskovia TaxID=162491 RepID=UPI001CD875C3|nr:DUF6069 family protein [Oerskovia gallyi]
MDANGTRTTRTGTRSTGTTSAGTSTVGRPTRRLPAWCVPLLAAVAAVLVWAVGTAAGVEAVVGDAGGGMEVGPAAVVVTSLVVGFAGWGVRSLLRRTGRAPRAGRTPGERAWTVTCAVVLLVSLLGPLGATSTSATLLLLALHVTVGAVVALGLRR